MDATNFSLADEFITIKISGMNCNHCVANVEKNLIKIDSIDQVVADLNNQTVKIIGDNIDMLLVKQTIEDLGYVFESKI
jgi:copper chaperone CopZ